MAKPKPKRRRNKRDREPSIAEQIRLGPEVAALKSRTKPKDWRRIVKEAHRRGFTVAGAISNVPDELKQRTQKSLEQEAKRTIDSAFKPAETELDSKAKRLAALDAKRQRDDKSYREWMTAQYGEINAKAQAADNALVQASTGLAAQAKEQWGAAKQQSQQVLGAQVGSNAGVATNAGVQYGAEAARDESKATTAGHAALNAAAGGAMARQMTDAATLAQQSAWNAQRIGDFNKGNNEIEDARSKLSDEKVSKITELLTGLRDKEMTKAQSNREYTAAAKQLGLKQDELKFKIKDSERQYNLAERKLTLQQLIAKDRAAADRAKIRLGYDRIKADQGQKAADRALKRELERLRQQGRDRDRSSRESIAAGRNRTAGRRATNSAERAERTKGEQDFSRAMQDVISLYTAWYNDGHKDRNWRRKRAISHHGVPALLAQAGMEIGAYKRLSSKTYGQLVGMGYKVPPRWSPVGRGA